MKEVLITILRNTHTRRGEFRQVTEQLSLILASEASQHVQKVPEPVQTPLAMTTGQKLPEDVVIVPILRAGLAMLPAFLRIFPQAKVGFLGMRRDEVTKHPHLYYKNIPPISSNQNVILIDPIIATGGSGSLALQELIKMGADESKIIYVGIVSAPEGIKTVKDTCPHIKLVVGVVDQCLNKDAFIVPGIGDFGDRYFGTEFVPEPGFS
jgi:uracil phosphoribosyltransferase